VLDSIPRSIALPNVIIPVERLQFLKGDLLRTPPEETTLRDLGESSAQQLGSIGPDPGS
jgi:hypothetical protein